jgi:peptide/nickel transport system permease protein
MPEKPTLRLWFACGWLVALTFLAFAAPWLGLADPITVDLGQALRPPSRIHWGGTDELGRDVLSRLVHAARSTILVTAGATALDILLAALLGMLAAYRGGLADRALSFTIDLFWSVPFVVFVVLIVSILGVSVPTLILTIGAINWVTAARVIRAETARVRRQDFIRAAEALGFSSGAILWQHVLPNLRATLLTLTAYGAIEVLTLETGLAFIGLSLPAPNPTWGGMLADGLNYFASAWWLVACPASAISLTLLCLLLLARHFEDAARIRKSSA